jgi:hypothetical protein
MRCVVMVDMNLDLMFFLLRIAGYASWQRENNCMTNRLVLTTISYCRRRINRISVLDLLQPASLQNFGYGIH